MLTYTVPGRFARSRRMKSKGRLEDLGLEARPCNVRNPKTARSGCWQRRADPGQEQVGLNQECCNKFLLLGILE